MQRSMAVIWALMSAALFLTVLGSLEWGEYSVLGYGAAVAPSQFKTFKTLGVEKVRRIRLHKGPPPNRRARCHGGPALWTRSLCAQIHFVLSGRASPGVATWGGGPRSPASTRRGGGEVRFELDGEHAGV